MEQLQRLPQRTLALPALLRAVHPWLGLSPRLLHRPGIVLFGEAMAEPAWTRAQKAAEDCDLMLVVGTSCEVFPAALLPQKARAGMCQPWRYRPR